MKRLWVAAALAPLTFAAAQASAQEIKTSTSTPVVSNGETIKIDSGVAITPSSGGTSSAQAAAVTQNTSATATAQTGETSVNSVTNSGSISFTGKDYVTGILINGGAGVPATKTGAVGNAGTISLTETTSYKDTNNDGIVDSNGSVAGQFATGKNRYGIQTTGQTYQGGIGTAGTISVIGENSAGVFIGANGISGNLSNLGSISVTGGNSGTSDVSYGINAQGAVGSVNLSGTISALGQNAIGVNLAGPVTGFDTTTTTSSGTTTTHTAGAVEINATITATGYRSTTAPTIPSILALVANQASSELLQGGPAVAIGGNVAGGVSLDAAVAASGSGSSTTAAVVGAAVASYGRAPALLIGSGTAATQVGQFGNSGFGLVLGGTVTGSGVYTTDNNGVAVGANSVQIGAGYVDNAGLYHSTGSNQVSIFGGVNLTGTVQATGIARARDKNGSIGQVTALHLGDVAITSPATVTTNGHTYGAALNIVGSVTASETTAASIPGSVTAIQIDAGSSVPSLYNRGNILAGIGGIAGVLKSPAGGGTSGDAVAIKDGSGSLASITNSGVILASITPIDVTQPVAAGSKTTAIDLSANTTGVTVTQVTDPALTGTTSAGVTTTLAPSITGDILFGSGNAKLDIQAGTVIGGLQFGGQNDQIDVNSSGVVGALAESSGGRLSINVGTDAGATTSLLDITKPTANTLGGAQAAINVGSIHIGAVGQLFLTVDPANTATQLIANGSVTFDSGARLGLNFLTKLTAQQTTYNLIEAGTNGITVANTSTVLGAIPYLYNGSVSVTQQGSNEDLTVTVSRKTAQDLKLNPAESAAYNAVYTAFDATTGTNASAVGSTGSALLSATDRSSFLKVYDQFLPDYSGGPFEDMVLGQQAIARAEADSPEKMEDGGSRGWVQEITYYNSRSDSDQVNGYTSKGFGFAGGVEKATGRSAVGLAAAFVSSSVHDLARSDGSSQGAAAVEAGAYWRTGGGGFNLGASVNGGWSFLESRRVLMQQSGTADATLYRLAKANWMGGIGTASISASYKESFGRYYVKPEALADFVLMYEEGHTEHGAGDSYDLTINSKLNKEAIVQADMVFGASYGATTRWSPELTVGYRDVVYGGPAFTTAHFAGGAPFTLSPDYNDRGGFIARVGLRASGNYADFNASAGGVFRTGYSTYDARATARFLF
ncbi:hypothetical protein [Phenylobacterium montanum]|uniref:Autotransporter domain-containing protein n=1 Tax=Phenylobacterium montanum TaxID=2823693 RepID=A0A975FY95_9CAUL|nr:hypothetical protein [Caulobacter sp. S6]QUD86501.1 hypothetical protein KCG34_15555 [Caulobacter sp. S6]